MRCPGFPSAAVPFSKSYYTIAQLDRKTVLFLLPLLSLKPGRDRMAGAKPCWLPAAGFPPALHPGCAQPSTEVPAAGRGGRQEENAVPVDPQLL